MKRAMVFIDFDNLAIGLRKRIASSGGGVIDVDNTKLKIDFDVLCNAIKEQIKCVSGNTCLVWGNCYRNCNRNTTPGGMMFEAHKRGIVPVYVPLYPAGEDELKSLCDPMLICDAMEALYENRNIDVFVLVSSDKDFIPLIRTIAEKGKEAIVIGLEPEGHLASECYRLGFDFWDYTLLKGKFKTTDGLSAVADATSI